MPPNSHLVTASSDGAGHFCSGVSQVLNQDLPKIMCDVYVSKDNTPLCPLFNLVGGSEGTTRSCDPDHLGKIFCSHGKSVVRYAVGVYTFTKSDIAYLLQQVSIIKSADGAHRLLNPEDLMDVAEMVKCIYASSRLGDIPFPSFPGAWRAVSKNRPKF